MKKLNEKNNITNLPVFINRFMNSTSESENSNYGAQYHLSNEQYKSIVIKDIENLLNFSVSKTDIDERFSYVKNSVIAYGGISFSGEALSASLIDKIQENIITRIIKFEPRINKNTIWMKYLKEGENYGKALFHIYAELVSPADSNIDVTLSIDLERGECLIFRQ
jgi:predicted component of type VI protein secretion system